MKLLQQVPFSTKYKFMATVVDSKTFGKPMFYVKGAPEIILAHCNKILTDEGVVDLAPYRGAIENQLFEYGGRAMRTLAIAYKEADVNEQSFDKRTDNLVAENLIFVAAVAIAVPTWPRQWQNA